MQEIGDIFGVWSSVGAMATDLRRKYDAVLAWRIRGRIPEDAWEDVIAAAARRGAHISLAQILELNAPMKKRGRPSHKVRAIRGRREARAS